MSEKKDAAVAAARAPQRDASAQQRKQPLYVCREELYVSGKDPHSLAEFLLDPDPLTGLAGVEAMCRRDRGETWRVTVDLLPLGPAAAWRHRRRLVREASGAGGAMGQGVREFLGGLGIGQAGPGRGFWAEFSEGVGLPRIGAGSPGGGGASSRTGGARSSARSRRDPGQTVAASDERRQLARQIARTDALFRLQLLLRTAAPTKGRAVELMQALRSCFADFAGRSSFQAVGVHLGVTFLGADLPVRARWFDWRMRSGWFHPARHSVVAAREIAALIKPPTKKCAADNVLRSGGFVPPAPPTLPSYRHQYGVIPLARITEREGRQRLAGIHLLDTNFGCILGATGTGKSELASLQFLWVAHHARWKHPRTGRLLPIGGLFVDPLGQVLERLPAYLAEQSDRLLLLDTVTWREEQPVIGWNPLDMSGCTAADIEPRVKPLLDAYMVANGWKPGTNSRAMSLFGNALISLAQLGLQLPADCQPTIFQLPTLLHDERWRQAVLPFLSKPVQTFWRRDYASLGGAKGEAAAAASHTVNLLRQSGPIAAMLGQSRNGLDLRRAMDEGKLIIACTAAAGEFETSLVSAILVLSLSRAAKSRVNIPQLERRPFAVWLDEALALDTPLPTPTGWTTMGEVRVGDQLIGSDGVPTTVQKVTDVMDDRPCYRVTFRDGTSLVASAGHQWLIRVKGSEGRVRVRTTEELAAAASQRPGRACQVPRQQALKTPPVPLPINPYVLGLWLSDGDSRGAKIGTGSADVDQIEREIQRRGYTTTRCKPTTTSSGVVLAISLPGAGRGHHAGRVGEQNGRAQLTAEQVGEIRAVVPGARRYDAKALAARYGVAPQVVERIRRGVTWNPTRNKPFVKSVLGRLREEGLLRNKHIPASYLRAGTEQREELLRGLMDGDGWASDDGFCVFVTTSDALRDGIVELLRSLGQVPHVTWRADARSRVGGAFKVTFTPRGVVPFSLPRKAQRIQRRTRPVRAPDWVTITCIEPVPQVPVRCVAVDAPDRLFLAGDGWHVTHNCHLYDDGKAIPGMFAEVRKLLRGPVCVLDQRPLKLKPETLGAIATNSSYVITASVGEDEARWVSEQWSKQVAAETIQQLAMGEQQPDGSRLYEYIARVTLNGRRTLPFRIRGAAVEELFADWYAPDRAAETVQQVNQAAGRRLPSAVIAELDTLDARILEALTGGPRGTTARGGSRKARARAGAAGRKPTGDRLFDQAYETTPDDEGDDDGGAA